MVWVSSDGTDAHHCTFERMEKSLIHKKQLFPGINLSLLKKISENPDLLKILSAIVGSL